MKGLTHQTRFPEFLSERRKCSPHLSRYSGCAQSRGISHFICPGTRLVVSCQAMGSSEVLQYALERSYGRQSQMTLSPLPLRPVSEACHSGPFGSSAVTSPLPEKKLHDVCSVSRLISLSPVSGGSPGRSPVQAVRWVRPATGFGLGGQMKDAASGVPVARAQRQRRRSTGRSRGPCKVLKK